MRKVRISSGPFAFRLYFEDLGEIDKICLEALRSQSLLPSEPAPIRIERFVEKQFKAPLRYEDLGPEHLGCTIFNSSGGVDAILVSRSLEEQNTVPARRRVRSTVAHEAGHGLLHGSLFIEGNSADLLNASLGEKQRRILCRSDDILVDTQRLYDGRWWAIPVVWLFNVWGALDLLFAFYRGEIGVRIDPGVTRHRLFHPDHGSAAALTTHGLTFWLQLRKSLKSS